VTVHAGRQPLLAAVVLSACVGLVGGALAAWGIYSRFGPVERVVTQSISAGNPGNAGLTVGTIAEQKAVSVVEIITGPIDPATLLDGTATVANGFAVSADGLVVTSIHAIRGASALKIATADGHAFPAVIVRADPNHGIALLRAVGAQGLPALTISGTPAKPGDLAIAVAHLPFFPVTLGTGTVSSTGRTVTLADGVTTLADALTVDATANPRADGAPLLNGAGQVIGVVVDAGGATGGLVGLSGRAASDLVQQAGTTPSTPTLGLTSVVLEPATAAALGLPAGAWISTVLSGGPAAQAGLMPGDVVTAVDATAVNTDHPLDPIALGLSADQHVTLTLVRSGSTRTVALVVGSVQS